MFGDHQSDAESSLSTGIAQGRKGFIGLFIILTLVSLVAAYSIYRGIYKTYQTEAEQELSAIGNLEAAQIVHWRAERVGDASILSSNMTYSDLIQDYLKNPKDNRAKQKLQNLLRDYAEHYDYDELRLVDTEGITRLSYPPDLLPSSDIIRKGIYEAIRSRQVSFVDFYRSPEDQQIHLSLLVPILAQSVDHRTLAVITLRINPKKFLYPIILKWPVPTKTAEALLVRREDNDVVYLNELKFAQDSALRLRIPLSRREVPAVQAVTGMSGVVEGVDYHGHQVIADVRPVPGTPWSLVNRIDQSEISSPMESYSWMIFVSTGCLVFGIGTVLIILWQKRSIDFYRKQAKLEETLQYERQFLLDSQMVAQVGSWALDLRTNQSIWTEQSYKNFGVSPETFNSQSLEAFAKLVHPEDRAAVQEWIRATTMGKDAGKIEFRVIQPDGSVRIIENRGFLLRDDQNRPFKMVGTNQDITERKKIERDLAEAKEAADSANLAKSAFLANMSHEIRTPLGAILGFAQLIDNPKIRPSEKANFTAAIKRNSELLSNIINEILDLSKIEAGKMAVVPREVSLIETLADTKMLLYLQANDKGIDLNFAIDEDVPDIITTDSLRLRQILINIIGNAVKFTSKGAVDVRVHNKIDQNGHSQLTIVVRDSGPGISKDQVRKLFAPFSQVDITSKRKFGGTGLGLLLSKRFANLLGGDVVLSQTTPGGGSTFTITIDAGPVLPDKNKPQQGRACKPVGLKDEHLRLRGVKMLLAEDSLDNQMLIRQILALAGGITETVFNGKEAIEKARKEHYDVILMDLQMPVMDGYEATAELRKGGFNGKILALTAHALSDVREQCLHSGFDDYVSKPVNAELLIERIYRLVQVGNKRWPSGGDEIERENNNVS